MRADLPAGRHRARRRRRAAGFTLLEVLAALGLVAAVGLVASASGYVLARAAREARAEAAGLFAAEHKVEELLSLPTEARRSGHDVAGAAALSMRRVWRVRPDAPVAGLTRLEVSVSWQAPDLTVLTLVAVAP